MNDLQCSIIAGGKSERMGDDKLMLDFADSNLLSFVVSKLRNYFSSVNLISNRQYQINSEIPIFSDIIDSVGPISGLHSALYHSKSEYCFICPADMPFFNIQAIDLLGELKINYDGALFLESNKLQPLFGFYHIKLLNFIENLKLEGYGNHKIKFSMKQFIRENNFNILEVSQENFYDEHFFFNINTKSDYARALEILKFQ